MKKYLVPGLLCLVLLLTMSCQSSSTTTTSVPLVYTNNVSTRFQILGEVRLESKERVGYTELLRIARTQYPDCDYIIDIMIDQRVVTTTETTSYFPLNLIVFFWKDTQSIETNVTWIMRGTAIRYVR